jgi:ABC-type dipeptide/oligopeptide/nickel transport system ATPase component
MANGIAIVGDSGSGKSTSIGNAPELGIVGLNPAETFIINVKGKPLPIRGWKALYKAIDLSRPPTEGNYLATTDTALIIKTLGFINANRPDIKNVAIDDNQYIMSEEFMANALKTGYDKFNKMAKNMYDVINTGINMRDDINFIILTHDDEEEGKSKIKTLGKMLDDKVNLAGLFTVVLYTLTKTNAQGTTYHFVTNKYIDDRGIHIMAKSPAGMFEEKIIPNDMGVVLKKIEEYNN